MVDDKVFTNLGFFYHDYPLECKAAFKRIKILNIQKITNKKNPQQKGFRMQCLDIHLLLSIKCLSKQKIPTMFSKGLMVQALFLPKLNLSFKN